MADSPFLVVQLEGAEVTFELGAEDDPALVENFDAEVTLEDGSRWSATFLTLAEIQRLMNRWKETGEYADGSYFQRSDLVIIERGGVEAATNLLRRLVGTDEIQDVLVRLDLEG